MTRGERTTGNERFDQFGGKIATSTLRVGLGAIGVIVLLFAIGEAINVNLLGLVVGALTTPVGQWLLVAGFGLALIVIAVFGFRQETE